MQKYMRAYLFTDFKQQQFTWCDHKAETIQYLNISSYLIPIWHQFLLQNMKRRKCLNKVLLKH